MGKVCDLYCDGGVDTDKWCDAQVGHYIGIGRLPPQTWAPPMPIIRHQQVTLVIIPISVADASASGVSDARELWENKRRPFIAEFIELDPSDVHPPFIPFKILFLHMQLQYYTKVLS
jgi:mRNA (guanine-N7-)-methyltransferase